jgi:hypothetical protein
MRALRWIICLWPGLSRLWLLGQWQGLVLAVGFAALLNLTLIITFVWPELLLGGPTGRWIATAAWILVLGFWIAGVCFARREAAGPAPAVTHASLHDDWLQEAQTEYLKGHWLEAELALKRLLADCPQDAEARLLMASVLRRTRRWESSLSMLAACQQTPAAARWQFEIEIEMQEIKNLMEEDASDKLAQQAETNDGLSTRRAA